MNRNSSKEQHLFEIEIICHIINVTFDELNASVLNESIRACDITSVGKVTFKSNALQYCVTP